MAETYTIRPADDSGPIDPGLLRELRDLLRDREDLDLGVKVRDRPPAAGEQGAVAVAVEIMAAAAPLGAAFASVLRHWIDKHKLSVSVHRTGDDHSIEISGVNASEAERLIAKLDSRNDADGR